MALANLRETLLFPVVARYVLNEVFDMISPPFAGPMPVISLFWNSVDGGRIGRRVDFGWEGGGGGNTCNGREKAEVEELHGD